MSFTRTVPAAVPSLFQSSPPVASWKASKNKVPFTFVRPDGLELPTRADVLDEDSAGGGAVALPELDAGGVVESREEECPVDVREKLRRGAERTRADVLDEDGAS